MEGGYGGDINNMGWSNCNIQQVIYDDVFSFTSQLPPVDHFRVETSGFYGFSGFDNNFQNDQLIGMQENSYVDVVDDVIPMAGMFLNDPFYSSLNIPAQNNYALVPELFYCDSGSVSSGFWDHEMKTGYAAKPEQQNQPLVENGKKRVGKRGREVKNSTSMVSSTKALSRETISQYFYMPITQAARELNVGLTLLKKRCRDLGIRRWPHRKLISLQTLIKNVQELGNEGSSGEGKLKEYLRVLEQEKKLLEEIPDLQLEVATKRLRQAFFKANYKKRKLMGMVDSSSAKSEPSTNHNCASTPIVDDDDDDEIKYFFDDCFSCN